jgi:heme/copper-type cytochrome/quinol oxidase subunit 2
MGIRVKRYYCFMIGAVSGILALPVLAHAATAPATLVVNNAQLEPSELLLPVNTRVKLLIQNQDNLPFEFESYDLSLEVVVPPHGKRYLFIKPLQPGTYRFFNDFDHEVQGTIVVQPLQAFPPDHAGQSGNPGHDAH